MRRRSAIRLAAATALGLALAAPLARRRLRIAPPVVTAAAALGPPALCVLVPRTRTRDVLVCVLQMWAYVATYQMPNDDPAALEARVRVGYPVAADARLGLGVPPGLRLQRVLGRPGRLRAVEQVLVWSHWVWFAVPHGTVAYLLLRHPERFPAGAARVYATFDLGLVGYWALPTAPPWYAAERGALDAWGGPALRRMMREHGEAVWGSGWAPMYRFLGGNPLAAMPSLHFATSVMAARLLREVGPLPGALGAAYAGTLGFALVYLGEHYVVDLLAGLALAEGVRAGAPRLAPAARRLAAGVERLGKAARA